MEEIFADSAITALEVKDVVEMLFPGLTCFEWDPRGSDDGGIDPVGFDDNNPTHVLYDIYKESDRVEFWWRISVYRTPNEGEAERGQLIAQRLSATCQIRTLVPFQKADEPDYPYHVLVYANGTCYLGSDGLFDWGGDKEWPEPVKILRLFNQPLSGFDKFGRLAR